MDIIVPSSLNGSKEIGSLDHTFNKCDGLLQSVSIFVAIVQYVSADSETGRFEKNRIDLVDRVQHRLQRLYFFFFK
jgi:hypothetical protein